MKKEFLVFRKEDQSKEGLPNPENTQGGAGNAETSGANEQADASRSGKNTGGTQAGDTTSSSPLSAQNLQDQSNPKGSGVNDDIAGPSSTGPNGEGEDIDNDGEKEREVKNSATENLNNPKASAHQSDSGDEFGDEEDEDEQARQLKAAQRVQAQNNQVADLSAARSQVKVLLTTLKTFVQEPYHETGKTHESAVKELEGVYDELDEAVTSAGVPVEGNQITVDTLSFDPSLTYRQKEAALISQLEEVGSRLETSKKNVKRSRHNSSLTSASSSILKVAESLKENLKKKSK